MSTFTDGAPPSVTPGPQEDPDSNGADHGGWGEADESVTTGSLWLREEIQRRIVGGRAGSVGRHARRDSSGRTSSPSYLPRHAVPAPPAPSGPPADAAGPQQHGGAGGGPTAPAAVSGAPQPLSNGQDASRPDGRHVPDARSAAIGMPSLPRRRPVGEPDGRPASELPTQAFPAHAPAPPAPAVDRSPWALRSLRAVPSSPALPHDEPATDDGTGSPPQVVPEGAGPSEPPARDTGGPALEATPPPAEVATTREVPATPEVRNDSDVATSPVPTSPVPTPPGAVPADPVPSSPDPVGSAPTTHKAPARPPVESPATAALRALLDVGDPATVVPDPIAPGEVTAPREATVPAADRASRPAVTLPRRRPSTPPPGAAASPAVAPPTEAAPDADQAAPARPAAALIPGGTDQVMGERLFVARTPTVGPGTRASRPAGVAAVAVEVPVQRDSDQQRGGGVVPAGDAQTDAQNRRVRVVLAERKGVARPVRTVVDIQEGTGVGELLRSNLIGSQLAVALRFAVVAGLTLGVLPLLFALFPEIGRIDILGLRLPWLLLGVLVYPFLLGLGWWHTRTAERVEQNFADHVQD